MKTQVYIGTVEALQDAALFQMWYAQMDPSRKGKIDGYRFQKDKRLSLGAGILLRRALGIRNPEIGYRDNGKPYLMDYPGIRFNLSHSGHMVMCAVSNSEVGCDIEQIADVDLKMVKRFFHASEVDYIRNADPSECSDRFFRLWTLKESFLKCTGRGLSLPLNRFSVEIHRDQIRVEYSPNETNYFFREYSAVPGYRLAVCCEKDDFDTEPIWIDFSDFSQ